MLTTSLALLSLATPQTASPTPQEAARPDEPRFAAPVRLDAGGKSLGGRIIYPSPRLLDIDRDGEVELVVGDLPGRVHVAEKNGEGLHDWSTLSVFKTDGRDLKFNNW